MEISRLEWLLDNWAEYMHSDRHRLGFPRRSLMLATGGGGATDAFEIMCDEVDTHCAEQLDAMIDSLKLPQRVAINHRWLKVSHHYPTQAYDLEMACEQLMAMADKRGMI